MSCSLTIDFNQSDGRKISMAVVLRALPLPIFRVELDLVGKPGMCPERMGKVCCSVIERQLEITDEM